MTSIIHCDACGGTRGEVDSPGAEPVLFIAWTAHKDGIKHLCQSCAGKPVVLADLFRDES